MNMYQSSSSSSKPSYHRGSGRSNSSGSSHSSHSSSSSVDMSAAQRTIHIGNLISSITDEMLINYFAKCGSITNLKLAGNPSYPARFAFIEFATVQQAHAACALAGTLIGGKPIKIAIAKNPITTPYTPSSSSTTTTTAAAAASFAPVSVSMYDTSSAGALYQQQQQQQQQYPTTTTTTAQDTAYYYSQFATNNTTSSDYSLQQHQQAPSSFDYSQQQPQQQQYHPYQQQPSHYAQATSQPTHDYSYHSTTLPTNNDHHYSMYQQQQQQQQPSSSYAPYSSYPSTAAAAVGSGGGGTQSSSHYSHPKQHHHQQQQQQLKKTIYIAGIDKELSEQAIINYFAKCGEIVNHRFCMGQPSKFAFIEYATHESAASAIQNFSGTWLGKCTLKVSFSKSPIQQQSSSSSSSQMPHAAHSHHHHKSSSSSLNPQQLEMISRTVHVGNLDGHLSENEIQQFFNDTCGGGGGGSAGSGSSSSNVIERFSMAGGTPVEHGKVARFCFIEFTNVTSAQMALQLNGTMLGSLNIRVSPSRSPILSSSSSSSASSTMNKQALTHNQRYVTTQSSLTNENVTPHLFSDNSAYNNGSSADSNNKFDASAILSSLKPRSILKKVQEQLQNQQQVEDGSSDKSNMTKKVSKVTTKTSATVKEPRTPPGSPPADLYVRQKALIMKEQQQQANRKRAREEERAATDEDETTGSTKSLDVISPKRAKITHDENQSHDSSASERDTTDHQ